MLFTILFALFASAQTEKEIFKSDVLALTGMTEKVLVAEVQNSLEGHLYYDDDGISCGLEEFYISHYMQPIKESDSFSVHTEVTGPVGYCGGYSQYMCSVVFKKQNNTWSAVYTECDEGNLYEE